MQQLTDKQYLSDWDNYALNQINKKPVDKSENAIQRKKRMEKLEAKPEDWFKYYFSEDNAEPAAFHIAATKRIIENPEWYEIRMWSRELAKTTRTMYEVIYLTLTKKKRFTLLISSSIDNATRLLLPYKAELELNDRLKNDYGTQERQGKWTASEFTTRSGATFRAAGSDGAPRGAKNDQNVRPDVLLFDDVDTDIDCRNPKMIDKTWNWIEDAAMGTRSISKDTLIIFCGNRIAIDCCVVRACKYADKVDEVNITDKKGNPTWPQKNSPEHIKRVLKKRSYASTQKEYYNNPIVEGSVFRKMAYKPAAPLNQYTHLVCYTDPSFKSTIKNDYKATVLVGKWRDEYHVLKAFVDQTTTAKMIGWHYEMMDYVGGRSCYYYMEQVFLQELIIQEFYKTSEQTGRTIPIMGDKRAKDEKFTRIESLLEPLHSNAKLFFNEDEKKDPGMQKLDEQFVAFAPGSRAHDDGPDATEGAVWMLNTKCNTFSASDISFTKKVKSHKRF